MGSLEEDLPGYGLGESLIFGALVGSLSGALEVRYPGILHEGRSWGAFCLAFGFTAGWAYAGTSALARHQIETGEDLGIEDPEDAVSWNTVALVIVALAGVLSLTGALVALAAFLVGFFRLPIYLVELVYCFALGLLPLGPRRRLAASPIFFDDTICLPLPLLDRHLAAVAAVDPELTRRAITLAERSRANRDAARDVLAELQAEELADLLAKRDFAALADRRTRWLPSAEFRRHDYFARLRDAARHLALSQGDQPARQKHLAKAREQLELVAETLDAMDSLERQFLSPALASWRKAADVELLSGEGLER